MRRGFVANYDTESNYTESKWAEPILYHINRVYTRDYYYFHTLAIF
jgi:hypothetical protein